MDDSARPQFQIHLPGLLKVLAENLYSTKKVAIRELLQNAHDSCVRRSVEGAERGYRPRIDVAIDTTRRVLTIRDNGSGLSAADITNYLATIGRSYTRELGEKLSILSPEEASKLIGQFGLGFLSAFLVGSEVTLITRSMQPDSPALRWHSTGDVHYDVSPALRDEIGTTVELLVKSTLAVQQALEQQLVAGLRSIALDDPATWKKIVYGHSDVIIGWAVRDNEFFTQVADIVTFQTSRGLLSLPDYLALTNDSVY